MSIPLFYKVSFTLCTFILVHCSTAAQVTEFLSKKEKNGDAKSLSGSRNHSNVLWWIQVSDLHTSLYHPSRARDLEHHFVSALKFIAPSVVLFTGDLTDAKSKNKRRSQQKMGEWKIYSYITKTLYAKSGMKGVFLDLRGNHDTYEVPLRGGNDDLFSRFSLSARKSPIFSTVLEDNSGARHAFVGLDIAPRIGLRSPSNFFGRPSDQDLDELDRILKDLKADDDDSKASPLSTIVVFGHYPLSFTVRSPSGKLIQDVLLRHDVDAYLCGHLHYIFGKKLYRFHTGAPSFPFLGFSPKGSVADSKGFWEWTAGDWKENRMIRLLASDAGTVSFTEFQLLNGIDSYCSDAFDGSDKSDNSDGSIPDPVTDPFPDNNCSLLDASHAEYETCNVSQPNCHLDDRIMHNKQPIVLVTMPVDCRFAPPATLLASKKLKNDISPEEIRVLVFSPKEVVAVSAKMYERVYFSGSRSPDRLMDQSYKELEQILLHPASAYEKVGLNYPFYTAEWDSKRYLELSASASSTSPSPSLSHPRYWIEISVEVRNGVVHRHPLQPFSVKGESCFVSQTWLEHVIMYTDWEGLWPFSLGVIYCIMFAMLLLPRIATAFLQSRSTYRLFCIWALSGSRKRKYSVSRGGGTRTAKPNPEVWFGIQQRFCFSLLSCIQDGLLFSIWAHCESSLQVVWLSELVFLVWTLFCPWFWGRGLGSFGSMSLRGWFFDSKNQNLGVPDILIMTLPFLILVVCPALAVMPLCFSLKRFQKFVAFPGVLSCCCDLFSERKGKEKHLGRSERRDHWSGKNVGSVNDDGMHAEQGGYDDDGSLKDKELEDHEKLLSTNNPRLSERKDEQEKILESIYKRYSFSIYFQGFVYFVFVYLMYMYFKLCERVCGAYGFISLLLSPGFAWFPLFILIPHSLYNMWCFK